MKGKIKAYSADVNAGVIVGDNRKTYGFRQTEWRGIALPAKDEKVTFDGKNQQATNISTTESEAV
jgi:hypothetical protein